MRTRKLKRRNIDNMSSTWINTYIAKIFLFLIFVTAFRLDLSISTEEQIKPYNQEDVDHLQKNLSDCARHVKASAIDVENFLKRLPQTTMQGKCFVACMLRRLSIIKQNKIAAKDLMEANKFVYGEDSDILKRLDISINECIKAAEDIFEICEYASVFTDCMHKKMRYILEKLTMERRMEALEQIASNPDSLTEEEDEILQLFRDEL